MNHCGYSALLYVNRTYGSSECDSNGIKSTFFMNLSFEIDI